MEVDFSPVASCRSSGLSDAWLRRHAETLWCPCANLALGAWLITAPASFGYESRWLAASDILGGVLVLIFAGLSLSVRNLWAAWVVGAVGIWLLFAPLVFWAPTAVAYANDTLVGTLLIVPAILIPGVPGQHVLPGPEVPLGWNYNPSAWLQRAPIIALAFLGFFIARYLTAYQLGHITTVWDGFFPGGTQAVLESKVSQAWPIPDAGLGAISYILEALTGFLGGTRRWRTMPWLVIAFGILVVPLGVTSIVLITLQPLVVGTWCTLCLVTAAAMLIMIAPAFDEVLATCQFLRHAHGDGQPFWRTFFRGGTTTSPPEQVALLHEDGSHARNLLHASSLTNIPWNLALATAIGAWLMFAPTALETTGAVANSNHLAGALVVTFSVIAWGDALRSVRWLNLLLAAWLLAAPWILSTTGPAFWNDTAAGVAIALLSIRRGPIKERFGTWDRFIF